MYVDRSIITINQKDCGTILYLFYNVHMKTLKKLFSVSAIVALLGTLAPMYAFGATYSDELQDAYKYAYAHKVTTMTSIDNANMYGNLTRIALAKMIANYATDVLGMTPDTSAKCTFTDVTAALDAQYDNWVTKACQLGLMGQGITAFRPNDLVNRWEFGTTLSRALNADSDELEEMNAATPFYKKHLEFLKSEGIMTQIDNPNQTEVRGYVMLMMMRADDSYSPDSTEGCTAEELLACITADDYDACIAACSEPVNPEEPEGTIDATLNVSVTSNNGDALIWWISDLDTINFKTSDKGVEVTKVTLERVGYSTSADVDVVRLEDENGTKIADWKPLNGKDQVTLSIKKDYRAIENNDVMSIVLQSVNLAPANNGSTIGFKVVSVESNAKNVNIKNYTPATYNLVNYEWSDANLTWKWKNDIYHFNAWDTYEIARFKLKASNTSAAVVKWFTLTNTISINELDLSDNIDDVVVSVDGNNLKNVNWEVNKNDELVISFADVEIAQKATSIFVVNVVLVDDFDDFGDEFNAKASDFKITEKKTWARIKVVQDATSSVATYTFNGSKVKLSNVKLGTVKAPADKDGVVVAEGNIELGGQAITIKWDTTDHLWIYALSDKSTTNSWAWIEAMRIKVPWDEFELKCSVDAKAGTWDPFSIDATKATRCYLENDMTIENDGKIQLIVDLNEYAQKDAKIKFLVKGTNLLSFDNMFITNGEVLGGYTYTQNYGWVFYEESDKQLTANDYVGSMNLSELQVQTAGASMKNNITKAVEFIKGETATKVIFDGTYTVDNEDISLNQVSYTATSPIDSNDSVTLHLYINNHEVATTTAAKNTAKVEDSFSNINVKAWEKVDVRVEAEVYVNATLAAPYHYTIWLLWTDADGDDAWEASRSSVDLKFVEAWSISIDSSSFKDNDVVLKASSTNLAKFVLKSSNEGDVDLDSLKIKLEDLTSGDITATIYEDLTVSVNWRDYDVKSDGTVELNETINQNGVEVEIIADTVLPEDKYVTTIVKVNTADKGNTFTKLVVPALVTFDQQDMGGSTKYTIHVNSYDSSYTLKWLKLGSSDDDDKYYNWWTNAITDWMTIEVAWIDGLVHLIEQVTYIVHTDSDKTVNIKKSIYNDYFAIWETYLKLFANK